MQQRLNKIIKVANNRNLNVDVVFEGISDPHNALASFRNCDAFGIQNIHIVFDENTERFDPYRLGKVTSSGANKWLNVKVWGTTKECFGYLKKQKSTIIATHVNTKAKKLTEFSFKEYKKIAFVFGNEHKGISDYAVKNSNYTMYVKQVGWVESLNLSVSVGVVLYEFFRQTYKKPTTQNTSLVKEWCKKTWNYVPEF